MRSKTLLAGSIVLLLVVACGRSEPPAPAASPAAAPTQPAETASPASAPTPPAAGTAASPPAGGAQPLAATAATWTPEALEDLLAPVALYPDPVLAQLLVAVTNPQEVLDAGNWLIANPDLKGKPLDAAAEKAGFTLPMRSLIQFPEVIDKLCLNMPWTEELGQAYVNDQAGVMDAVQRLRVQAKDAGNLKTSKEMKVATTQQEGKQVVTLEPAKPNVVYVPQYDPVAAYAPAGTTITTPPGGTTNVTVNQGAAAAPATTTTTTTSEKKYSTGSLITTGLLAFGAGMIVNEIFDDDDDDYWNSGYYGGMYYRPMPYYPPYGYRPSYGGGFYPGYGYNRPPVYIRGGNTIIVNQNNNYYNRYRNDAQVLRNRSQPRSPITAARPNRPELQSLNAQAARGPQRRPPVASEAWKGKGGYAGNDPRVRAAIDKQAAKRPSPAMPGATRPGSKVQGGYRGADPQLRAATGRPAAQPGMSSGARPAPKVQGSYAGQKPTRERPAVATRPATPGAATRPAARPSPTPGAMTRPAVATRPATPGASTRPATRPAVPDRGRYDATREANRAARPATPSMQRPSVTPTARPQRPVAPKTAVSRGGAGRADAAAGARGRASMPPGGAAKARATGRQRSR